MADRQSMLLEQLWREVRFAARRLAATPVFTIFAVVSLAIGLGVTTAAYSTINSLLFRTSSIRDPNQLAVIGRPTASPTENWQYEISKRDFDHLRTQVRSVPALAASTVVAGPINDGTRTSWFTAQAVTGNYVAMVELPLRLGRGIQASDDRPGANPVLVLSYEFWQSQIDADPQIVGRTVRLAGHPFVVIGVAAERLAEDTDQFGRVGLVGGNGWIALDDAIALGLMPVTQGLTVFARLPSGVEVRTVSAEVSGIGAALDRVESPGPRAGAQRVTRSWLATSAGALARTQAATAGGLGTGLVLLVAMVLVVASTNLANLSLGRGVTRIYELNVRRALGATRGRLIREQCIESAIVALLGGWTGLVLASVLLPTFTTDVPIGIGFQTLALRPRLDTPALFIAGGSLLAALMVFGIAPAIQLTRMSLRDGLGGDTVGSPPNRWAGRRRLIATQVTIATALLLLGFAAMRLVVSEARHDPGFDLEHLALGRVDFRPMSWDATTTQQVVEALGVAAERWPGLKSVALTAALPMGGGGVRHFAEVRRPEESTAQTAFTLPSTPAIFRTLGVPIFRGRGFDSRDTGTTKPVIVISEQVARQLFGRANVVGEQLIYQGPSDSASQVVDVIGIARDIDTARLFERSYGAVYVPLAQHSGQAVILVGRATGDPQNLSSDLTRIVRAANPDLALQFATGPMVMAPEYVLLRPAATVSTVLSLLAIVLAMLGLYGVLSHLVARRTREIGVRLALGAEAGRVRRMIVADGLRPVLWGLAFGLLIGVGARQVFRATNLATTVSAVDPAAFAFAALAMATAGFLACHFPARRASRIEPNVALRDL